ncbi:hypothetical protein WA026_009290 [Henosepilachna vigintioctopunctata]|uniref:Uncharacterized protein n=1 Tax=Henosepilachna vigintioctopunctata TaxID=420089 RepID=A0AAW1UX39_9CUCU
MFQAKVPFCCCKNEQIRNSASVRDGFDFDTEAKYRREGAMFSIETGGSKEILEDIGNQILNARVAQNRPLLPSSELEESTNTPTSAFAPLSAITDNVSSQKFDVSAS